MVSSLVGRTSVDGLVVVVNGGVELILLVTVVPLLFKRKSGVQILLLHDYSGFSSRVRMFWFYFKQTKIS